MGGDDRATERNAQADARGAGECRIICIRVRTLTRQVPRGAPPTGRSGSPQSRASPARAGRAVPAACGRAGPVVHTTMYGKECELTRTLTIKAYDKSNRNSQSHRT